MNKLMIANDPNNILLFTVYWKPAKTHTLMHLSAEIELTSPNSKVICMHDVHAWVYICVYQDSYLAHTGILYSLGDTHTGL